MLVLWDLDHTLLHVPDVSQEAYARGFERATGRTLEQVARMTGRTDRAIISDTLRSHRIDPVDELIDQVGEAIGAEYRARAGAVSELGHVLPGAAEALRRLGVVEGVVQSVLTGNMRSIAEVKVEVLGLAQFLKFEMGGFGMDAADRTLLVGLARQRATRMLSGRVFDPGTTVLVGDTPLDVAAGRLGGARVVAVTTGSSTREELQEAGADVVLDDLSHTDAVIRAVTG